MHIIALVLQHLDSFLQLARSRREQPVQLNAVPDEDKGGPGDDAVLGGRVLGLGDVHLREDDVVEGLTKLLDVGSDPGL